MIEWIEAIIQIIGILTLSILIWRVGTQWWFKKIFYFQRERKR